MVRGMTHRGIGVGAAPSQDRGTIYDEVAPAHEAPMAGKAHEHDQQALARRRSGLHAPAALLGGAGHPRTPVRIGWQPTGQREGGPGLQPVMQILIR
jgi:hypothetical protein